jgi:hypothetical protein
MDDLQITDAQELRQLQVAATGKEKRNRRRVFKPGWVRLPMSWLEALERSTSVSAYRLAGRILVEAFKREQSGGEIVLSTETTGMPRSTRARAVDELIKLGLIKIKQNGNHAIRVTKLRS